MRVHSPALFTAACLLLGITVARGQGPASDSPSEFGASESLLGEAPGALRSPNPLSQSNAILGGRPGASTPRVPVSVSNPGGQSGAPPSSGVAPTPILPPAELPVYGSLSLPTESEAPPGPGALTLDTSIELLIRQNLTLRAQFLEIPQAQADILTASLRANPILYADTQLVPYGSFSDARPGGQTQYDVNVSIPLDLSGKRQARMNVAGRAKQVVEAQYQNAVRLQIDNLYTTFIDVLAAAETIRFAEASVKGLDANLVTLQQRLDRQLITAADVNRVRIQRDFARIGLEDARETLRKSQISLAELLALPLENPDAIQASGSLRSSGVEPPPVDALVAQALQCRPDLIAFRIGVMRARAEIDLAEANAFADVYWLVQPYTFQDNAPNDRLSATSWAMGVTVPLPLINRNQGNIQRARINASQTQTQLAAIERQIAAEVRQAEADYRVSRQAVDRIETDMIPAATQVLDTVRISYEKGQIDVIAFLVARQQYNDVVRQYRDVLVRGRRNALRINTAVGQRLLP